MTSILRLIQISKLFLINYTDNPNIELMTNGEWMTLRDIKKGEELLEDPKRLLNPDGSQKVFQVNAKQYPLLNF